MSGADEQLTRRQQQVVALLALGSKAEESARLLGVKPTTIHRHRGNAKRRLGARTLPHLVYLAVTTSAVELERFDEMSETVTATRP